MASAPLLGWISPSQRTQAQHDSHAAAVSRMVRFTLSPPTVPKGTKILLTDAWKHPKVVADLGAEFTGFHQLTGSCVGASAGNAVATLAFVQRLLTDNPTKAFVPWWPYFYGRTRYNEGDRGQGEGAVDSVMGQTLHTEGVFDAGQSGLPAFKTDDGLYLTSPLELQWSDGSRIDPKWIDLGKKYPVGSVAAVGDVGGIKAGIANGYPCLNGCDNYCAHGTVKGSGADAYVTGHYDGRGGHSTCVLGYWEHPNDGPLYLYSNQWPASTYPQDPAGAGRCCVWLPEAEMAKLFRTGGSNGECLLLSHLTWFPAQPDVPAVLDWSKI